MLQINSKTALITGAAKRVGREVAIALAKAGFDIALHYNSSKKDALEVQSLIKNSGRECEIFSADLSKKTEVDRLFSEVSAKFNNLSLLVNNASIFEKFSFMETTEEVLDRHFAVNFKAPFFLTQHFAKFARANKIKNANIVNILDSYINGNSTAYFAYLLSKKSFAELTKMTAKDLGPDIRVNGICPGLMIPSEYWNQEMLDKKVLEFPLKKVSKLEDIYKTVIYLDESQYLTGQLMYVDSGQTVARV
jgi:NAD(P)-dependent dehydrogenase (short-subunit alcohol dehydrogenase family)